MSKLEVDTIAPQSGTTLTVGESGHTVTIPTGVTLDASNATTTLPANVVTTDGTQTLTNKSIDASQLTGTITPSDGTVTNAKVNASAAIEYSKLNLTGNIALADLSATGTKDSTTFLRGDNSFATPVSGGFVKLSHNALTSNAAIIVFDGLFSSDYLSYKIVGNLKFTSNARLLSRWYIGNAEDSTNAYNTIGRVSNMHYDGSGIYPDLRNNGGFNYTNHTYDFFDFGKDYNTNGKWYGTRTASDSAGYLIDCTISDPQNSSRNKMIFLNACWQVEGGNSIDGTTQNRTNQSSSLSASGSFYSTSVCTGICFLPSAGNFSSGSYLTLYGLAK